MASYNRKPMVTKKNLQNLRNNRTIRSQGIIDKEQINSIAIYKEKIKNLETTLTK